MNIHEAILKNNPCYKTGQKIAVKGLMIHSVGCPQPKAQAFIDYWGQPTINVCVHGLIDGLTGEVYQTLPWNHRGWHAGGSANSTHIGIEMCEPDCIKYTGGSNFTCSNLERARTIATRTYNKAVELFAYLAEKYNLNPMADGVIISHKEGHKRGVASNHGDPEHLWNQLGLPYTMDTFRRDVNNKMANKNKFPKCPFMVRVKVDDLNYRTEPSIYAKINGQTGKGSFTIVEVKGDWGKLKSGAGWIYIANTTYCTIVR